MGRNQIGHTSSSFWFLGLRIRFSMFPKAYKALHFLQPIPNAGAAPSRNDGSPLAAIVYFEAAEMRKQTCA
jgi:hypothetical protein